VGGVGTLGASAHVRVLNTVVNGGLGVVDALLGVGHHVPGVTLRTFVVFRESTAESDVLFLTNRAGVRTGHCNTGQDSSGETGQETRRHGSHSGVESSVQNVGGVASVTLDVGVLVTVGDSGDFLTSGSLKIVTIGTSSAGVFSRVDFTVFNFLVFEIHTISSTNEVIGVASNAGF
jgi:hypothetical protein